MAAIENLLSEEIVERLGWTLIHFVWQATVVALLLAVALRLLRRCSANSRYLAGCAGLALMVALPVATVPFVRVSGPLAEAGPTPGRVRAAGVPPAMPVEEVAELPPLSLDDAKPLPAAPTAVAWHERLARTLEPGLPYLVCGWLLGVFGLSAWHLGGWAQLQRLKRRMVCEVGPELKGKLRVLAERLGVRRAVGFLESTLVEVPTVVGWVKPVILLPASTLTGLTTEQLEAVLAHELAHIRRCDYLVNVFQTMIEILGFYHPAVWWVSHRIRIERENCCDDVAVGVCGDSVRYARALTHLEEMRFGRTALAVAATGGSLIARIARLLGRPTVNERRFTWLPGLVALLLVAGLVIPAALVLADTHGGEPPESSPAQRGLSPEEPPVLMEKRQEPPAVPPRPPSVQVASKTGGDAPAREKGLVLIDFKIAEVPNDTRLDRETTLALSGILETPIRLGDRTGRSQATLNEILAEHVARHTLSDDMVQTLMRLLHSRDCMKILASPQVLTRGGEEARVNIVKEEYYMLTPLDSREDNARSEPKLERIATGTKLAITPHILDKNDNIVLEMGLELCDALPRAAGNDLPVVTRRAVTTTLAIAPGEYFALPIETEGKASQYVLVKATLVKPAAAESTSPPTEAGAGPRELVNADPLVQELAQSIAQTERELIVLRQTLASQNPEVVQKQNLLDALNKRLEQRRKELRQQSIDHRVTAPRHILLEFTVAEVSADKRLSPEAARQISALLSATDGHRSRAVAARPETLERCSVGHLLQSLSDKVPDETYKRLLDALESHHYMTPLSAPHMTVAEGEPATFILSDLLELGVVAKTMKDRNTVQMDINLDLKLTEELPLPNGRKDELQAAPTSVRNLQTQTTLAAADRRYAVLELGGIRETSGQTSNRQAFYLFVKPEIAHPQPSDG